MKRIVPSALALTVALGMAGCSKGGAGAEAIKLIPDGAQMVGGANLKALMATKSWTDNKDEVMKDGDVKEAMEAAKECNLDPEKFDTMLIGANAENHFVAVISGPGVGKEENLKCIADKAKEKSGEEPFTIEDKDGKKVLKIDGGDAYGYMVGDNMVAVADAAWSDKLAERVDGKGTAAVDGSLKDAFSHADTGKMVWFAGIVPEEMAKGMGPAAETPPKTVSGWMDMSSGLEINVTAEFADGDAAKKLADEGNTQFEQVKPMGAMFGVPAGITDSVKIEAKDAKIVVTAKASQEDLDTLTAKLKEM